MTDDHDDEQPVRMMQTGPHTFVQWDTAVRLGLREFAPEQEVRGALERAAEIVAEECPPGPDPRSPHACAQARVEGDTTSITSIVMPRGKYRTKPVLRSLDEILADCDRAGPGPGRPRYHGAQR